MINIVSFVMYVYSFVQKMSDTKQSDPREDIHHFFIREAIHWSERSTCLKWQVGCILVADERIVSTGYNGSLPKAEHCRDYWTRTWSSMNHGSTLKDFIQSEYFRQKHRCYAQCHEVHAEQNAILYAARSGRATQGTSLYTSLSPCIDCAKSIVNAGIVNVYYHVRKYEAAIELLERHHVTCHHISFSSS